MILAIQTAFGANEVALASEHTVWTRQDSQAGPGQDARLHGLALALLDEAGATLGDVDKIAVATGPGSFTGLRMGLAFARGLGLVLDCPVVGITTLEASLPSDTEGAIRVALQAKKRPPDISFWCQDFQAGQASGPPVERPIGAVPTASALFTDRLDVFEQGSVAGTARPSAVIMLERAKFLSAADAPPSPVYVRPPDATPTGGPST